MGVEEIRDGIYRIDVPLPGNPLKFTNSYVIKGDRVLIVDTGMNREECKEALESGLDEIGVNPHEADFFITHLHADHSGLVPILAGDKSTVYFNKEDVKLLVSDYWERMKIMMLKYGFSEEEVEDGIRKHPGYKYGPNKSVPLTFIEDKSTIDIGRFKLECIITPGHTPGHTCLYEKNLKILFSGDHILEDITPNISLWWTEDWSSLEHYLKSLKKVSTLDVNLVLPGHRRVFPHMRKRVEELIEHHRMRLAEILRSVSESPKTPYQVASEIKWEIDVPSWEQFPVSQKWFAVGETAAHLKYLEDRGKVIRKEIGGKVYFKALQTT